MSGKKKRFSVDRSLTQGIGQVLEQGREHVGQLHFEIVPVSRLEPDPDNPRDMILTRHDLPEPDPQDPQIQRKRAEKQQLESLAISIKRSGVQQPIVVYRHGERFRIAMGERRFLASILAGKDHVPARIWPKRPDDYDLRLLQYVENVERLDLTAWERVQNIRALVDAYERQHGTQITPTLLAEETGFAMSQASMYVHLVKAPEDVCQALKEGDIGNLDKAALIARLSDTSRRLAAIDACRAGAGLDALRQLAGKKRTVSHDTEATGPKRAGRPPKKIALGSTGNVAAVRRVMEIVVREEGDDFGDVDWDDLASVTKAWKQFWKRQEERSA